jgi:hypothetical protein
MAITFYANRKTPLVVFITEAGQPLVRVGGFKELSEAVYDNAFDSVVRNRSDVVSVYDIALSGGEPYALWS